MTDGEVAACLLNLVYPRAFSRESLHGIDVSCELRNNKDLFLEAAFAQQFIAKKEGMLLADAEDAIFHMFAFVPQNDGKMMLLHDGFCYDVTAYFEKHVWNLDANGHRRATFVHLLESASFKMRDGCMYAVVADKKLIIARELKQLQQLYSEKYGNYEIDKSMTPEDWADMSSLNASISEAEAFELEVDDENSPQKVQAAADSSALQSDERYELFQQIEQLEKKLLLEQERFEYSMIPGEDVREARNSFYKAIVLSCTVGYFLFIFSVHI
ncbi:unnamed protein product [Toxocara canis]|uniref:BTB domain-containing protein n=1 Tax=Toxocara canis TaxID=6265 RepID=A0A183VEP5_TOXCA|nr:unnamed protein product [Toxocara canis]